MRRPRTAGMFVGLLALPVALLGALPAVGVAALRRAPVPAARRHPGGAGPPQLHRGVKVKVTGAAQGQLRPGTSAPVALTFQNPNKHKVQMKRVRVKISAIVAPNADAAHPCTTADFAIRQMPRRTLLRLPAKRTTDLAALGVPMEAWPRLTMLNRPLNQDGCKGAEAEAQVQGARAAEVNSMSTNSRRRRRARPPAHRTDVAGGRGRRGVLEHHGRRVRNRGHRQHLGSHPRPRRRRRRSSTPAARRRWS